MIPKIKRTITVDVRLDRRIQINHIKVIINKNESFLINF